MRVRVTTIEKAVASHVRAGQTLMVGGIGGAGPSFAVRTSSRSKTWAGRGSTW